MSKYPLLTSPIKIGSKTFKHRMVAAPIYCGPFALMPFFSDVLFNGIVTRAEGGCAEVIVGETAVDFEHANREPFPPVDYSIHSGPTFDRLKEIADRCKAAGAVTLIELSHCGRSRMDIPGMGFAIGPSEGKNEDGTDVVPMDRALMDQCIESFINCAKFMRAAGYEGVMSPCTSEEFPTPTKRPAYSSLDNMMLRVTVGDEMRHWKDALKAYFDNQK